MLARVCKLAISALALLAMLPVPSQAELAHRAAAMNGTSSTASVLADLWQMAARRQHTQAQRAGCSRRAAVRQQLGRAQAACRRWWSAAAAAAYGAGRPRVTARFLAEAQQNASVEASSLEQQYAAVTAQLQAKAALLQSYASQAAAVTQARYGSFARIAQVQLQDAAPPGKSLWLCRSKHGCGRSHTSLGLAVHHTEQCRCKCACADAAGLQGDGERETARAQATHRKPFMPPRCCRSIAKAPLAAGGQAPAAATSKAAAPAADDAGQVRQRPLRRRRVVQQLPAGLQPRRRGAVRARRRHVLCLVWSKL